jgi:hypothetical protein
MDDLNFESQQSVVALYETQPSTENMALRFD